MAAPHRHGGSGNPNGAARAAPSGPRSIKLRSTSLHHRATVMRAEREIRAREASNHARLHNDGSESDHVRIRHADRRVRDENQMNERFRKARLVGKG